MTFGICESDGYLPRVADMRLDDALRSSGAVHIKGPKWCGKTETGIHHTRSQVYLQDPDKSPALLAMADSKPSELLIGDKPRLIDEWQMAPQLWDAVRFAVDREKVRGGYVLTGSSTPRFDWPILALVGSLPLRCLRCRCLRLVSRRERSHFSRSLREPSILLRWQVWMWMTMLTSSVVGVGQRRWSLKVVAMREGWQGTTSLSFWIPTSTRWTGFGGTVPG